MHRHYIYIVISLLIYGCQPDKQFQKVYLESNINLALSFSANQRFNDTLLERFEGEIRAAGNRPEGMAVLRTAKEIHKISIQLQQYIDSLIKYPDEIDFGRLTQKLDNYVKKLNHKTGLKLANISIPSFPSDSIWLSSLKVDIQQYEKTGIKELATPAEPSHYYLPMPVTYTTPSGKIQEGDFYEAYIFYLEPFPKVKSKMTINGEEIHKIKDGVGYIEIPVPKVRQSGDSVKLVQKITLHNGRTDTIFTKDYYIRVLKK